VQEIDVRGSNAVTMQLAGILDEGNAIHLSSLTLNFAGLPNCLLGESMECFSDTKTPRLRVLSLVNVIFPKQPEPPSQLLSLCFDSPATLDFVWTMCRNLTELRHLKLGGLLDLHVGVPSDRLNFPELHNFEAVAEDWEALKFFVAHVDIPCSCSFTMEMCARGFSIDDAEPGTHTEMVRASPFLAAELPAVRDLEMEIVITDAYSRPIKSAVRLRSRVHRLDGSTRTIQFGHTDHVHSDTIEAQAELVSCMGSLLAFPALRALTISIVDRSREDIDDRRVTPQDWHAMFHRLKTLEELTISFNEREAGQFSPFCGLKGLPKWPGTPTWRPDVGLREGISDWCELPALKHLTLNELYLHGTAITDVGQTLAKRLTAGAPLLKSLVITGCLPDGEENNGQTMIALANELKAFAEDFILSINS
jgi:hypothetical protein